MSGTFTNSSALLAALQKEFRSSMDRVEQRSFQKAKENAEDFYSEGSPNSYKRTGKYGDAPDSTGVSGGGNYLTAEIYMNPYGHGYRTGTFSAQEVWQAAEDHTYGVLGKPGRWAQTEQDIQSIIDEEFGKSFK